MGTIGKIFVFEENLLKGNSEEKGLSSYNKVLHYLSIGFDFKQMQMLVSAEYQSSFLNKCISLEDITASKNSKIVVNLCNKHTIDFACSLNSAQVTGWSL